MRRCLCKNIIKLLEIISYFRHIGAKGENGWLTSETLKRKIIEQTRQRSRAQCRKIKCLEKPLVSCQKFRRITLTNEIPISSKTTRFDAALFYKFTMSSADVDSDLIPPDEWYDPYLRFALYLGGAFQLLCIIAVLVLPSEGATKNTHDDGDEFDSEVSLLARVNDQLNKSYRSSLAALVTLLLTSQMLTKIESLLFFLSFLAF